MGGGGEANSYILSASSAPVPSHGGDRLSMMGGREGELEAENSLLGDEALGKMPRLGFIESPKQPQD